MHSVLEKPAPSKVMIEWGWVNNSWARTTDEPTRTWPTTYLNPQLGRSHQTASIHRSKQLRTSDWYLPPTLLDRARKGRQRGSSGWRREARWGYSVRPHVVVVHITDKYVENRLRGEPKNEWLAGHPPRSGRNRNRPDVRKIDVGGSGSQNGGNLVLEAWAGEMLLE